MLRTMCSRLAGFALFSLFAGASVAAAQPAGAPRISITTGIAMTSQWDDETHLGRGVLLSVGATTVVKDRLRVEGEVSLARHHRDLGALETTGTPVVGTARAAWLFGSSQSRVRPFVSVGAMLTHSRGDWVQTMLVPGPGGPPVVGSVEEHSWKFTRPGFETGLGVELRAKGRIWWRPEVRFSGTTANNGYRAGGSVLETPLIAVRGGVTVLW
jgi:hypothetical protein